MKCNETIRKAARIAGVPLYLVAHQLGVSEPTIHRWLRFPLSKEKEQQIMKAISEIETEAS